MKALSLTAVSISLAALFSSASVFANSCPASHPLFSENCNQCFADAAQASSAGCSVDGEQPPVDDNNNNNNNNNNGNLVAGCTEMTPPVNGGNGNPGVVTVLDPVAYNCTAQVGNGNDGCINTDGLFVSRCGVVSNPENSVEAMLDIEFNLGIDIDDEFIAQSGYQGTPPSLNPSISVEDARTYFRALLGDSKGDQLVLDLNTNGDGVLTRSEASAAKGADPTQTLNTGFGNGLATDDILAYIGLYWGDGAIDKYAGDLDPSIKDALLEFTRTWQPGTDLITGRYTGPGTGNVVSPGNGVEPPVEPPVVKYGVSMALQYVDSDTALLYHTAEAGFTGQWYELCFEGDCKAGKFKTKKGRYQREVTAFPGNKYTIGFRIQDDATGQCVTEHTVKYKEGKKNKVKDTNCD